EVANPSLQEDLHAISLCAIDKIRDVDEADVARSPAENESFPRLQKGRRVLKNFGGATRVRHEIVDDEFRLARDPIDDVIDADRLRDVIDEKDQPADTQDREQHRRHDGCNRYEHMWLRPYGRKGRHAKAKRAEEDAQRPLSALVPDKTDQDPRRKLR